jgi:POLQ-like helicase
LKVTIKYGIAYHHSGLTNDEKMIIEKGYRQGILFVLVATSTLSTGINLPAKVVIFKTPLIA